MTKFDPEFAEEGDIVQLFDGAEHYVLCHCQEVMDYDVGSNGPMGVFVLVERSYWDEAEKGMISKEEMDEHMFYVGTSDLHRNISDEIRIMKASINAMESI